MSRPAFRTVALTLLAVALSACDRDSGSGAPPPPGAKPGHLTGKLADAQGKPLSNVTVSVYGFTDKGEPVTREVKIPGPATEYAIPVPDGKYTTPVARVGVEYNERWYELPLAAADGTREWTEQMDSRRGLVRDWVWKIAGPTPVNEPLKPTGYWGGTIHFDKQGELGDYASIEITLKPVGPLIDGTEGKTLVINRKIPWARHEDHYLFDIPIGKYTATAKQVFGSKPKPLRLMSYSLDPTHPDQLPATTAANSTTVEFECVEIKPGEYKVLIPYLIAFPPG